VYIGSVVIDCNDFAAMYDFWRQALGYVPREAPEEGWAVLQDPDRSRVNVSLQKVPEPRSGKNRLHFDLYTTDQAAEIARLLTLGATRFQRIAESGEDFVTLQDPEGNVFDVIDHRESE
jgi:catechol 2,3-dioxygenase-like lactoylglutathione lyase family enzyme